MKGTIVKAAKDLVVSKFGEKIWLNVLIDTGFNINKVFYVREDIDDKVVMQLIGNIAKHTGLSIDQVLEAFADHWVNVHLPEVYPSIQFDDLKEYILSIDEIHVMMTESVPNAKPPRFDYEWKSDKELIMTYKSHRGLIDLAVLILRKLGEKYNEKITVEKIDDKRLKIIFP